MGRATGDVGVMAVNTPEAREVAQLWVERTCAEQGVAVKVTDPAAIQTVVVLLDQSRQTGSTRSGSKRVRPRTAGPMTARSSTAATIAR